MSEVDQPVNQTTIDDVHGLVHSGSGDINLLLADLPRIIALLKKIIPEEQADAIDRLVNALRELGIYQKRIGELKFIHNTLHDLETGLAPMVASIRTAVRQNEPLSLDAIEELWKGAVLPHMRYMRVFAEEQMIFSETLRFEITSSGMVGPQWIKELVSLQLEIEVCFKGRNRKQNTKVIYNVSGEMLDKCREHLLRIDRRLMEAINKLEQFSDQILKGVENA
jgi:hypothetical protein